MTALGNNAHIFAQPHRWQELAWCFEDVLGSSVETVERPGRTESILVVRFPDGGNLSIEFTDSAPDDNTRRLGAWLELRVDDPAAVMAIAVAAALMPVQHPGHRYYFMLPGGQVFTIVPTA